MDECSGQACGPNAVCINTAGGYDCRCKEGHAGNPFTGCQRIGPDVCLEPSTCKCSQEIPCPAGYIKYFLFFNN